MHSERSYYRKVQVVLEHARSGEHIGREGGLAASMIADGPRSFAYPTRKKKKTSDGAISSISIKAAVKMAVRLRLLDDKEQLTTRGNNAADADRYARVVGQCTQDFLHREFGIEIDGIWAAVRKLLALTPPVAPTIDEVWRIMEPQVQLPEDMRFRNLRPYLVLLGETGKLPFSRKTVFLLPHTGAASGALGARQHP